ncbi:MAG: hypothetical protein DYG89_16350 [Caldilinea sp. CFX5]|nr:hypothetical protein [Caldilinea sp. CFX5]
MQSPLFRAGPLSIGDLLDWTLRLYRARFGKMLLIAAIFMVPLGLLSGIVTGQTMTSYLNIFLEAMQNPEAIADPTAIAQAQGNMTTLSYLLTPIGIAINGLVTLALTVQVMAAIKQEEMDAVTSIRQGARRFWPWVGMTFATYAAYIGIGVVVAIVFFFGAFFLAMIAGSFFAFNSNMNSGGEPGFAAMAGLVVGIVCAYAGAFILFVSPFIYVGTRWAVAVPLMIDQGMGPLEALGESWQLTKGHIRHAMGFVVLLYLFYGILYIAFMALAFAGSGVALTSAGSTVASVAIFSIVAALVPLFWMPIATAGYVMLYYDLRMRKQGYDLELRIDALETEVARAANPAA